MRGGVNLYEITHSRFAFPLLTVFSATFGGLYGFTATTNKLSYCFSMNLNIFYFVEFLGEMSIVKPTRLIFALPQLKVCSKIFVG